MAESETPGLAKNAPKDTRAVVACCVCLGKGKGFKAIWSVPEIVFICHRCSRETIEEWCERGERPPPCGPDGEAAP